MADSTDDEIIELIQMVEEETSGADEILELTQMAGEPLMPEDPVMDGTTAASEVPDGGAVASGINPENISQEQLDAAIERVIEKKFAQRIEKILFEVTETVLKREIAEIKAGLQKDLDDIDNA